eukprot:1136301-Pelagomonas_calceolata.AAC.4
MPLLSVSSSSEESSVRFGPVYGAGAVAGPILVCVQCLGIPDRMFAASKAACKVQVLGSPIIFRVPMHSAHILHRDAPVRAHMHTPSHARTHEDTHIYTHACAHAPPCALRRFKALADKKKLVTDEDIIALVSDELHQPQMIWELLDLQVG